MNAFPYFICLLFGVVLAFLYAAYTDMTLMKIRNKTVLIILALGAARCLCPSPIGWVFAAPFSWHEVMTTIGWDILTFIIVFIGFFLLYISRGMGAGDVKLIAAGSLWFGSNFTWSFIAALCVAGGIIALTMFFIRSLPVLRAQVVKYLPMAERGGELAFPYGPAIALGAFWACYEQIITILSLDLKW